MKALICAAFLLLYVPLRAASPVEETVKAPGPSIVHLWAPWCSNCQAELKSGGWLKMIKDNPETKFVFVAFWNNGEDGSAMLKKFEIGGQPNVIITADAGPRSGPDKAKQYLELPVSWIPTTWIFKGGNVRYALNYGEVNFPILQQLLTDTTSDWSHKGE